MKIRKEQPSDYREVENLTRESFWNIYRPGCTEHFVLHNYRNNPDFIPELDFVMEEDDMIIGHIMFSKATLISKNGEKIAGWTFGPISIHPKYKRKGYGIKLLRYAIEKAKEYGIKILCMEGNIDFYKHAGFILASSKNIHYHGEPETSIVPYFLTLELEPGYLNGIECTYYTPEGYFVADNNPKEFKEYDSTFPKKEKLFNSNQLPQFCRNCGIPLKKQEDFGTEKDGSSNFDYCKHCYQEGIIVQDKKIG